MLRWWRERRREVWITHGSVCIVLAWSQNPLLSPPRSRWLDRTMEASKEPPSLQTNKQMTLPPQIRVLLCIPNWVPHDLASRCGDNKHLPLHSAVVALYRPVTPATGYQGLGGLEQKMARRSGSWECLLLLQGIWVQFSASTSGDFQQMLPDLWSLWASVLICAYTPRNTHGHIELEINLKTEGWSKIFTKAKHASIHSVFDWFSDLKNWWVWKWSGITLRSPSNLPAKL